MTSTCPPPTPTAPRAWPMYRALVGTGLLCGLLIVAVYEVTRPVIERNRIAARERAILAVLPGAQTSNAFRLTAAGHFEPAPAGSHGDQLVFAGYDAERRLVGVAVEAQGMGYQDVIKMLYGYAPERQAVIGFQVLESRETPGLGTRIETDPDFLRNFEALDVAVDDTGAALRQPIALVKPDAKEHAWQVDGISGATISSRAIAEMLSASTAWWVPRLRRRLADFRHEGS